MTRRKLTSSHAHPYKLNKRDKSIGHEYIAITIRKFIDVSFKLSKRVHIVGSGCRPRGEWTQPCSELNDLSSRDISKQSSISLLGGRACP
jgi:hypothetical protein